MTDLYPSLLAAWTHAGGDPDYAIAPALWQTLAPLLRPGLKTLETGSGLSTWLMAAWGCNHTALEHDPAWYQRVAGPLCGEACVHLRAITPQTTSPWYAWQPPGPFDLILIDGPTGDIGRGGILQHLPELITPHTVIVVDDTHRPSDRTLCDRIVERHAYRLTEHHADAIRRFGVLTRK